MSAISFRGRTTKIKDLKAMYKKAPERTTKEIYNALEKTGNTITRNVVNKIKKKKLVDSGKLLQSARTYPLSGFKQVIEVGADYAAGLEYGTSPRWVPIKPLKRWAERKTGKAWVGYIVQENIAKNGTQPKPFFNPAIEDSLREVRKHWDFFDKIFKD